MEDNFQMHKRGKGSSESFCDRAKGGERQQECRAENGERNTERAADAAGPQNVMCVT